MTKTRKALLNSILSLMLCFSMLLGTTYAWFTDSVTSANNIIQSGRLKAQMEYSDDLSETGWKDASTGAIFDYQHWEPGFTQVKYIKVKNTGNLAFKYLLNIAPDGAVTKLAEVIDVYCIETSDKIDARTGLTADKRVGTLFEIINGKTISTGALLPEGKTDENNTPSGAVTLALAMKMREDAGNEYQGMSLSANPEGHPTTFAVKLLATQNTYESDSFDDQYDAESKWPGLDLPEGGVNVSTGVTVDGNGKLTAEATMTKGEVSATVPAGVAVNAGTAALTLSVSEKKNSESNVTTGTNEELMALDVHIEGVSADNTTPITVKLGKALPVGLNLGNVSLYHVENGSTNKMERVMSLSDLDEHNEFYYDPATGEVTVAMATFSEIALLANTTAAWEGKFDYSWYTNAVAAIAEGEADYVIANADQLAAFGAIVGGMDGQTQDSFEDKTVKLLADINLGDKESENNPDIIFYPIGYNSDDGKYEKTGVAVSTGFYTFEGTFDGNGHSISNFYQNTWEMKGDHNWYDATLQYYRDGMGLFGKVYGGTVKNLTVDNFSSDGEFTPTGVIAAYAVNSTFENIAITNCNPRVYNTGNGGIVGIGGNSDDPDTDKLTFTNITIDNTNKITALWGSWDVACGGLVGMFRGAGHVHMTNCHVAAQIDVYNDVCGNYQYYWYRYSGMMVGTNKNMTTDANGYTVPETDKFHAENCTVHFGDWNDYYYCELVANSLASYTHDHQFSRLTQIQNVSEIQDESGNWNKTGNFILMNGKTPTETCYHIMKDANGNLYEHKHDVADATNSEINETVNGETVLKENNQRIYLPFNQLFTGYGWGVKHIPVYNGEDYAFDGITILDREVADSVEKFETKFTGDFLYRVGNQNTVALGSLFKATEGATIKDAGVYVSIDKVDENMNVSGTFTANTTDWTKGTIQFSGTGVVKVTIQDYNFCTPTELYLEVVDAVNATTATSATKNNVVLLNDCGFSSLEVSGGYTLYGNGFTMTCSSDSAALDMGYSFVTLNNGTLDNVQIVCPNFDYAVLYKSNMTESGNRSETTDKTRYFNVKSGVMVSGNSQILNSRISGGRAAVNVSGGNVVIDNSRIELGAVASVLVGAANSLTLRDVTLVQKPTASTYDSNKKLMGFSVLYLCDSEGKATPTTLEGSFVQQAWVNADDKQYVPSAGQDIVDGVMKETAFIHNINGKDSLNLGFAYMPEDAQKTVAAPDNITDNRTDKATIPYEMKDVKIQIAILSTTVYVYSYKNTNGTADSFKTESGYVPNKYSDIITVTYSDTADGLTTGKSYGTDGWVYELNVDLDKLSDYALDFDKLTMSVNGVTVTDYLVNGNAKPASPVAVTAGGTTYTLTATVNGTEYTATYKVTGTETSKESPSLVASNYGAGLCVASSYGGTWHGAAPALEGIQIKYWSVAEKQYKTITLSDYTPTTAGKQNGTNTTWTYSPDNGDFTLTLTGGQVHSSNNVYAMPVVCDGKLYFVAASSKGLVNSGNSARTIPVSYTFKDNNNGDVLTFSHTWSVAENKDEQYNYSDFCNGTLTKLEDEECVTGDTLITMADGTQKPVEDLAIGDMLLVFNHITGKLEASPLIFNTHSDENETKNYKVLHLEFSNGEEVKIVASHGFFDMTLMQYVYITYDNYTDFIGHEFCTIDGETVELTNAYVAEELTRIFCPVTYFHMNSFANGMLNTPNIPGDITGLVNYFEYDSDLKYNEEAMQRDIEKYGLYTYDDFSDYISEAAYHSSPAVHLKVAVGKGMITFEEILDVIDYLLAGSLIH